MISLALKNGHPKEKASKRVGTWKSRVTMQSLTTGLLNGNCFTDYDFDKW